jgi:two-component system, NarL family, sensor kinase
VSGPSWEALLPGILEVTEEEHDVGQVMRRLPRLIAELTGADACFVHLHDEARGRLVLAGATPPFDAVVGTIELAVGEGVAGWVVANGQSAVVEDKWSDPRYKYIAALRGEDFASMVSLPLVRPGRRVVGAFNLHTRERRSYSDDELALLSQVAAVLAGFVENALLYQRLAEREAELERFAARVVELQEVERRRLAAEIHDGISQRVVSLYYRLSAADALLPPGLPEVAEELAAARELATAALDEARRAITGLRPSVLDDLGLAAALESLAGSLTGVDVEVDAEDCGLASHLETAVFRIAQEALQNVAKHAAAGSVRVALRRQADEVRLEVADDGRGFEPAGGGRDGGFGLVSMQERAALMGGRLRIESRPGAGTTVTLALPAPDQRGRPGHDAVVVQPADLQPGQTQELGQHVVGVLSEHRGREGRDTTGH